MILKSSCLKYIVFGSDGPLIVHRVFSVVAWKMALTVVAKGFLRVSGRGASACQEPLLLSSRDAFASASTSASLESSRRSLSDKAQSAKLRAREEKIHTSEKVAASSRKLLTPPKSKDAGKRQRFSHFLVIDLEATCDHKSKPHFAPNEIIEFPVFKGQIQIQTDFLTMIKKMI